MQRIIIITDWNGTFGPVTTELDLHFMMPLTDILRFD